MSYIVVAVVSVVFGYLACMWDVNREAWKLRREAEKKLRDE